MNPTNGGIEQKTKSSAVLSNEGDGLKPSVTESNYHAARRYFARMVDSLLYTLILSHVVAILPVLLGVASVAETQVLLNSLDKEDLTLFDIVIGLLSIFPAAALTGYTGSSFGKWLFGIKITDKQGSFLGILRALRREAYVLVVGLALRILQFAIFTSLLSYYRLKRTGKTYWDEKLECQVHYREGRGQLVRGISGLIFLILLDYKFIISPFVRQFAE